MNRARKEAERLKKEQEKRQKAEVERVKREQERLRREETQRQKAEAERTKKEEERKRKEAEKQKREQERLAREDAERKRKDAEKQKREAERLEVERKRREEEERLFLIREKEQAERDRFMRDEMERQRLMDEERAKMENLKRQELLKLQELQKSIVQDALPASQNSEPELDQMTIFTREMNAALELSTHDLLPRELQQEMSSESFRSPSIPSSMHAMHSGLTMTKPLDTLPRDMFYGSNDMVSPGLPQHVRPPPGMGVSPTMMSPNINGGLVGTDPSIVYASPATYMASNGAPPGYHAFGMMNPSELQPHPSYYNNGTNGIGLMNDPNYLQRMNMAPSSVPSASMQKGIPPPIQRPRAGLSSQAERNSPPSMSLFDDGGIWGSTVFPPIGLTNNSAVPADGTQWNSWKWWSRFYFEEYIDFI